MKKIKYYYIDDKGNKKRYRGNVEERNGKLFGVLILNRKNEKISDLIEETEGLKRVVSESFKAYRDKQNIEHKISKDDKIVGDKVEIKHINKFDIKFTPATEKKIWFEYYNKDLKQYVEYAGEVFEENGKYYGEREIV